MECISGKQIESSHSDRMRGTFKRQMAKAWCCFVQIVNDEVSNVMQVIGKKHEINVIMGFHSMDRHKHHILETCSFLNVDVSWLFINRAHEMNEIVIRQSRRESELIAEKWPQQSKVARQVLKQEIAKLFALESNLTQCFHVF
jgi:hypothetical protein